MTIATTLAKTTTAVYVDKPVSAHDVSIQNNNFISEFNVFDLVFVHGSTRGASRLAVESNIQCKNRRSWLTLTKEAVYFVPVPDIATKPITRPDAANNVAHPLLVTLVMPLTTVAYTPPLHRYADPGNAPSQYGAIF